jgi:CsoR family transcriptional regulator, copper-sensing transcriptional repressor
VFDIYPWGVYVLAMKKEIKRRVLNRLNRVEGQVRGLKKMVENEKYCVEIITQSSAARSALSAVEDLMLENHLSTHVMDQMKGGKHRKAADEILSVYKISRKR